MRILIEDLLTVTMNRDREIARMTLLIENGRFERIYRRTVRSKKADRVIKGRHLVAIPGLINGHIHCDVTLARGLGDGLTLYQQDHDSFVSQKGWFNKQLDRRARHLSRLLQYAEAVRGGTTYICDVPFWHYGDDLVSPFNEVGVGGAVVLDYRKNFLTKERVAKEEFFQTAAALREAGFLPIVELPAEEDFDPPLLKELYSWAEELDTMIQLHFAETRWRVEMTRERLGSSPVAALYKLGILTWRIIGSHGVYIDETDLPVLKDSGARIVNCPAAEMKIADGIAPVVKLIEKGVPVGIGTDGALWNDSADMFREMKTLMLLQRVTYGAASMDAYELLRTATIGGAEVFGMEHEIGSIEKGKRADLVLIDLNSTHLTPHYHGKQTNILQVLTSCVGAGDVHTVIVDGKVIVENGRICTIDEEQLKDSCQALADERLKELV
jgi:5-methylthioadenosine/S-adenosylhomocysteine deaminase